MWNYVNMYIAQLHNFVWFQTSPQLGQGILEAQDVRVHLLNLLLQQLLPLRPLGVGALRVAVVLVDPPAILAYATGVCSTTTTTTTTCWIWWSFAPLMIEYYIYILYYKDMI